MTRPTRDQALAGYLLGMLSAEPQPMFVEALANMLRDARAAGVSSTEYLDGPAQPQGYAQAEATPPEAHKLVGELRDIRLVCATAGCVDPGIGSANRTLCMVEELRQRCVCTVQHPEPADDIIRAAEGVMLGPGEYIAVSGSGLGGGALNGERFSVTFGVASQQHDFWIVAIDGFMSRVTVARRIAPVAEPEPVPESGREACPCNRASDTSLPHERCCPVALKYALDEAGAFISAASDGGEYPNRVLSGVELVRVALAVRELEAEELRSKVSELEGKRLEFAKDLSTLNEARGRVVTTTLGRAVADKLSGLKGMLASEEKAAAELLEQRDARDELLDEMVDALGGSDEFGEHSNLNDPWRRALDFIPQLRGQVRELESQPSGKYFGLLRIAMGDRWKDCSSWADAIPQVSELVATLAATEAKLTVATDERDAARYRVASLESRGQ